MSSVVKQLMYVLKLFRVIDDSIPFLDPCIVKKRFGSCIQSIRFWI